MSYFPLRIVLTDSGKELIVHSPEEIPKGISFKVLACRVN